MSHREQRDNTGLLCWIAPFGNPRIIGCYAPPRGVSPLRRVLRRLLMSRHPPFALIANHPNADFVARASPSLAATLHQRITNFVSNLRIYFYSQIRNWFAIRWWSSRWTKVRRERLPCWPLRNCPAAHVRISWDEPRNPWACGKDRPRASDIKTLTLQFKAPSTYFWIKRY